MSERDLRREIVGTMKGLDYKARVEKLQYAAALLRELRGDMTVNTNTMPLRNITLSLWHQKLDMAIASLSEEIASVGLLFEGVRKAVVDSRRGENHAQAKSGRVARGETPARRDRVSALRE